MKMNKTVGRVATTLVATAMLASLAAVPAFAENDPQFTGTTNEETGDYTVTMKKIIKVPDNVLQPNATFNFTATPDYAPETFDGVPVETTNTPSAVTVAPAVSSSSATEAVENAYTINFNVTVDLSQYKHAGVYKYLLKETPGSNSEITYDQTEKYLYVIIENKGTTAAQGLEVAGVVVKDKTESNVGGTKSESFTNSYNGGAGADTTDLTLTKTITGDAADLGKEFSFTISIDNGSSADDQDNQVFKYWNDIDNDKTVDDGETGYVTANGTDLTLQLGNSESVVIYGLRANDRYTITENGVTSGKTADGYTVKINGSVDEDGQTSDTVQETDISVTYDNSRAAVSPTGIVMNVAPYALLVVIAAAGCFVFLRKRRED